MRAAEGRSYASCTHGTRTSLCIALPLKGAGRGEADKDKGPVDLCPAELACHGWRAPDLQARAGRAKRSKPDTATIRPKAALVDPSTRGIDTSLYSNAGQNGFGDFCRSCASCASRHLCALPIGHNKSTLAYGRPTGQGLFPTILLHFRHPWRSDVGR